MTEYRRKFDGDVCAMSPVGDWEHSLCGGVFDGDIYSLGRADTVCSGPVTCQECAKAIQELRIILKSVRVKGQI